MHMYSRMSTDVKLRLGQLGRRMHPGAVKTSRWFSLDQARSRRSSRHTVTTCSAGMLTLGNNDSNGRHLGRVAEAGLKIHPARFPVQLPERFIRFLTDPGDTVLDIFGGSMTTGWAAERMGREWIGIEIVPEYVAAGRLRFFDDNGTLLPDEYRGQPPLVPVIDLSPNDGGVGADVPELTRSEIRPAS